MGKKHQTKKRSRKSTPSRKSFIALIMVALLAGLGWLAWEHGYIEQWQQSFQQEKSAPARMAPPPAKSSPKILPAAARTPVPVATTNISHPLPATNNVVTRQNPPSAKLMPLLDGQIALDRLGFSSGSIDGRIGSQTRAAIRAFQRREKLTETGELDAETCARIALPDPVLTNYRVESADLERLLPLAQTWLGKHEQPRLDYETILELVAERTHAHPDLLRRLNPQINWSAISPGAVLTVPATEREAPSGKATYLRIRLSERTLAAFDAADRLLAHFPCSIAQRVEKRPSGELRVTVVIPEPNYTFNPETFPESAEAREIGRKLVLPPGPNNPVGTAWVGLDLPGYGIHGTPRPEDVGRTESHGCFRLANWNAEYLLQLVLVGTTVRVEP